VGQGWFERTDAGAAAGRVFRPRTLTAQICAISCAALLMVCLVTGSRGVLWLAAIPFLLLVQCFQRVVVADGRARRTGLRAVDLDLTTAEVKKAGRSWWVELFFLGRCLELRDAERHGLLLESWLWSKATRAAIVDAARAANPVHREIRPDQDGWPAHS
jgi:hypothetical protein